MKIKLILQRFWQEGAVHPCREALPIHGGFILLLPLSLGHQAAVTAENEPSQGSSSVQGSSSQKDWKNQFTQYTHWWRKGWEALRDTVSPFSPPALMSPVSLPLTHSAQPVNLSSCCTSIAGPQVLSCSLHPSQNHPATPLPQTSNF